MFVRHSIFVLPIHKRSAKRYYEDHDRWVESHRSELEGQWRGSFEEIPAHIRIGWKDCLYWPPWYFNDLVGYLKVGSDGEASLAGDVFLKRQHFRLSAPERFNLSEEEPLEREQVLYFGSTALHEVELGKNPSYLAALELILKEADKLVRSLGRGTQKAKTERPRFRFDCIDFAEADRQLRAAEANRDDE